jgi:MATE family multidrug resistance protein
MKRIDISYRNILRIAAPVLLSTISYTAMGVIDTIMVGRLGVLELAAVGLGNLLTWWFLSFFYGLLGGVNAFVAQSYGADEPRAVGAAFWQGLYLALLSGVLITACWFAAPRVFVLTGASEEMRVIATDYSQIRLLGGLGLVLLVLSDNVYRGLGRTEIPMIAAWCQLLLNCGFNYVLIFGKLGAPALGARGAALGTIAAQTIVGVGLLASLFVNRGVRQRYALATTWRLDLPLLRSMVGVSLPIGIQFFMEMGGVSIFTAVVARLGDEAMAATNAVLQAYSVAFMLGAALAVSATTLVGQCLGANQRADARRVVSRIWWAGFLLTACLGVVYLAFPEPLIGLFVSGGTEAAGVFAWARPLFVVVVFCMFFELRFNLLSGALRGAGDTRFSMMVNVGSAWLVFVPAVIWATPRWGLLGAWWCLVAHVSLMSFLMQLRYRGDAWLHRLVAESSDDSVAEAAFGPIPGQPEAVPRAE